VKNNWTLLPKNDWIYVKIYCGQLSVDRVLTNEIVPIINEYNNDILNWFFLKYYDPDHHLRIRFKFKSNNNQQSFVATLLGKLKFYIDNYLIWKVAFDTYNPELNRYAYFPMEITERLFQLDSVTYIENIPLFRLEKQRVLYNLSASLYFIRQFYRGKALINFVKKMETQYKAEFKLGKKGNNQLSTKYRSLKSEIEKLLDAEQFDRMITCLTTKDKQQQAILSNVTPIHPSAKCSFVSSHIHLNTNRTFVSVPRLYELITYDFLVRYVRSYAFRTNREL